MTNKDVQAQVESILTEAMCNLDTEHPGLFDVVFFNNSRTAGRAVGTKRIEINTDLARLYPEQLRDTVLHELAHCLTTWSCQRRVKPHGPEWQDWAVRVGADPTATHRMEQPDLPVVRHATFTYRCGCREHQLKAGRHNKHICYGRNYRCRSCGETLEYQNG